MDSVGVNVIETAALGRPFHLGMLYDCRKDALVPGITLWDKEQLQQSIRDRPQINTVFNVTASDSVEDKSNLLNIDGCLKLSLLSGLINVNGAAKYLSDTKKSFKQQRLTLHYHSTTKFEELTMNHLASGNIAHYEVFDNDTATHVVTAVLYGADACFVFDREVASDEDKSTVEGELKAAFDKLKGISVGAQIDLSLNDKQKTAVQKFSCKFYGDFQLQSNPASFEDALNVFADLPKLLGEKKELAVPLRVWLYPLDKLHSRAAKLQKDISLGLIKNVESVFETLSITEMKCSDLLKDTPSSAFAGFCDKIMHMKQNCSNYKLSFITKVGSLLPKIRGDIEKETALTELLREHEECPFRGSDLEQWVKEKEKESVIIKTLLNQLIDFGATVEENLDQILMDLKVKNMVSYTFTSFEWPDVLLSKQKAFLSLSTKGNKDESDSKQNTGFTSDIKMTMRSNLIIFKNLTESKTCEQAKFIVASKEMKNNPGSCILLYENGSDEASCFTPPSEPACPVIEQISGHSVVLKVSPACSATKELSLLYKMKEEKDWKSQSVLQSHDTVTLTDLSPDTEYEMKYAAVGKLNYIVHSDVIRVTTHTTNIREERTRSKIFNREKMAKPSKNEFLLIVPDKVETTEVKPGSDVTVGCHLSPEMSAADMEIRWFKGTDCVCLYMEGQMIPGKDYNGRVGLNKEMKRGNISLELKEVRESDEGDYLCQVTSEDRTKEKTIRLSLKNHEILQTEETTPEQTVLKEKMEKSALMAVFSEWKDTSKCLEKAKQKIKEKEAEIEELKAKLLQVGTPEKENRQLENMQENSKLKPDHPKTKTTPPEKQLLKIADLTTDESAAPQSPHNCTPPCPSEEDPLQEQGQEKPHKSKKDESESESGQIKRVKMENDEPKTIFSEWKDTSKCLEKAKQKIKEKEAETEELKAKLPQVGTPEKENKQLENMQENSKLKPDHPKTKTTPPEKQLLKIEKAKVFFLYSGNANALHKVHKTFIGTLQNQIVNLREVGTVDESDIILIFCPIVSRAGTDIDSALMKFKANTGSKQAVLVVLHHTFDPEKIVPDSSRCVNRTDILTVDCLFNEDTGLLDCQKNSDAYDKVVNWLIQQGSKTVSTLNPLQEQGQEKQHKSKKDEGESESRQIKRVKMENDEPKTKVVKVFSISTGKINECDQKFIGILGNRIENVKVVHTEDESDIILVFCPIVSRAGTDIEAALKFKGCTDSEQSQKLTVLVVFHHTFDPEKIVPDSSRCVNRTDILTVDCLFYEDTGLLECQKNSDAYDKVVNWLIQQGEKTGVNILPCGKTNKGISSWFSWGSVKKQVSRENLQQTSSAASCPVKYFVSVTGDAQEHHVHFIKALQKNINLKEVPTVEGSDVILLFCPDISGCHKRTDRPVVLISLHQTLDPENPKRRVVFPVNYILRDGEGLIECQINNAEISAVSRWMKDKKQQASRKNTENPSSPVPPAFTSSHRVSYFTNLTGDVKKHLIHFIYDKLDQICLNEVSSVEDSDVILLFCPDISDCNKRTDKPVVLISLHNTPPSYSVPSSNEFVNRRDIVPLDCIYVEGQGLPDCKINQDEFSVFSQVLSTKIIKGQVME